MDVDFSRFSDREIAHFLFERYGSQLYHYARKAWSLDEDDVWDVLYDSIYGFIRVYADRKFPSIADVEKLLWKIFKNRLRDRYRQKKRHETQYREISYEEAGFSTREECSDHVSACNSERESTEENVENPALRHLETILESLEDWERQLLLCRANGIPYSDIAVMTGMKAESLKVYYHRLKNRISSELDECFAPMEKEQ